MCFIFCKEIINILQRKVVFGIVSYYPKYSHVQKRESLGNLNILQNSLLHAKAITHRYLLHSMPGGWPDTQVKQRLSVENTIHTLLDVWMLQVMP